MTSICISYSAVFEIQILKFGLLKFYLLWLHSIFFFSTPWNAALLCVSSWNAHCESSSRWDVGCFQQHHIAMEKVFSKCVLHSSFSFMIRTSSSPWRSRWGVYFFNISEYVPCVFSVILIPQATSRVAFTTKVSCLHSYSISFVLSSMQNLM